MGKMKKARSRLRRQWTTKTTGQGQTRDKEEQEGRRELMGLRGAMDIKGHGALSWGLHESGMTVRVGANQYGKKTSIQRDKAKMEWASCGEARNRNQKGTTTRVDANA